MNEVRTRLTECFSRVFPSLSAEQIQTASQSQVAACDSIAAISLVNVIEEEFNTTIEFEDVAELDSFDAILVYVNQRVPAGE